MATLKKLMILLLFPLNLYALSDAEIGTAKQQCESGDGERCFDVGIAYFQNQNSENSLEQAMKYTLKACNFEIAAACRSAAGVLARGDKGRAVNLPQALELARKACSGEDKFGCALAGEIVQTTGKPEDIPLALEYYTAACQLKHAGSCHLASAIFWSNNDQKHAFQMADQSCRLNYPKGCKSIAFMYLTGQGVEKNTEKGSLALRLACDGGIADSCGTLSDHYREGIGGEKDMQAFYFFADKACQAGVAISCQNLAIAFKNGDGMQADSEKSSHYLKLACQYGEVSSCQDSNDLK